MKTMPFPPSLLAAPHTPMRADGSIHLPVIEEQAALLHRQQVAGAFICGTTGEGPSLSTRERMAVTEAWVSALHEEQTLVVNVGHNSLSEARDLATHARDCGVDAISIHPPCYFRPASVEDLIEWCEHIATAAPGMALYYYHIPVLTGVRLSMVEFLRRARKRIPTLRGIKFSDTNLADYRGCLCLHDGAFDILFGVDEMLLGALSMGGTRAIGSTYNYAASLYHRMIGAFQAGDLTTAQALASRAVELCEAIHAADVVASGKACMAILHGIDCGPVRPPLRNLHREEKMRLEALLSTLNLPRTG